MNQPAEGPGAPRRPVVFQEAVAPARVYGVWPVTVLAGVAFVIAVVATIATSRLRHTGFWWLPAGSWVAVAIGCYGMWHMRWHRRRVLATESDRRASRPD